MSAHTGAGAYQTGPLSRAWRRVDLWLIGATLALMGLGLLSLVSYGIHKDGGLSYHRQVVNVIIGLIPAAVFATVNPRVWMRASRWLYGLNILSLIAIFRFGAVRNGSARWIELGPIQFQPSEMAMLFTILTLAAFYAMRQDRIDRHSTFLLGLLHVGVPMVLILKQPHFGGALVLGVIWAAISMVSNVPPRFVAATVGIIVAFVGLAIVFPKEIPLFHGYHNSRIEAALGEDQKANSGDRGINYQTDQARIAFGVGGVAGVGFGKGEQGGYIPEQQTDFIFTICGEELGLIGCSLALATFGLLFYRIWLITLNADDVFSRMVATGVLGMLAFHTFVNLFMVTQMLPVIGLWLPFMSYGGTAMWLCMSGIALVLNIRSRERPILF